MSERPRVVVWLPNAVERAAVCDWLTADGLDPVRAYSAAAAAEAIRARPVDLLVADAALAEGSGLPSLVRARNTLASTVLVGDHDARSTASGVLYLARPIDRVRLSCCVWMEILDRRPFRRSVRKAINRFEAIVNGVPSHIVDVSADGLRLELPRDFSATVPATFTVRIPMVGVAVKAQRMWMRSASSQLLWCGGALWQNRRSSEQGWQSFVDLVPTPADKAGAPNEGASLLSANEARPYGIIGG
jgi:CheY-like chemotaxis protein